ncbi:LAME_0F01838g1_1 [Lachancea meyersii CBS 8951]|uniref:rRNA adenine N(6)-methyltransferase n=1 Tax=Lachancea meyersii CBS 8951 TaxID=1266667 RepID=A0A1G4JQ47_9SACH|nr:LAME_0F01838g1_1 [Lachancea meyersii CBS 8951]
MSLAVTSLRELAQIQHYYGFRYVLNPSVHEQIFDKLKLSKTYPKLDKLKVLDLYPGPAQHSAIFNNRYRPAQHVLMDMRPDFVKHISGLLEQDKTDKPAMQLYRHDPYDWKSYTDLTDADKILVPPRKGPEAIHDEFLIMANLTGMIGEGLFMQWLACIGNRNWLQRFGRVKMLVWLQECTAVKLLAKPGDHLRSKCSLVTEAFTDTKLVATMSNKKTGTSNFSEDLMAEHQPVMFSPQDVWLPSGKPLSLLEINPRDHRIDLDNFDYVTKHLLILKSTPLYESLDSLGHGGKEYFRQVIKDQNLLEKCPKNLTLSDFLYCTELFDKWPFKPDIYLDFIDVFQDND